MKETVENVICPNPRCTRPLLAIRRLENGDVIVEDPFLNLIIQKRDPDLFAKCKSCGNVIPLGDRLKGMIR